MAAQAGEEEGRGEIVASVLLAAMSLPPGEREGFIEQACASADLRAEVHRRIEWEERMGGFLLEPLVDRERFDRPFQPGETVLNGRFQINGVAGEGGMGIVYDAFDTRVGTRVALKCPRFEFRKRLSAEVRKSLLVMHRNACRVYSLHTEETETGPVDFLSMEFLDGETLGAKLETAGPEWVRSAEGGSVIAQIFDGLEAVHRCGVVHRDLKPGNVMLTPDTSGLRAVITDFGIAEAGDVHSSNTRGAPAYVAPELWKGEPASVRSDIYALGAMLFVMAARRTPFHDGASWEERLGKLPDLEALPRSWRSPLARCLDPDPARRFATVAELRTAMAPSRRWLIVGGVSAAGAAAAEFTRRTWFASDIRLAVLPPPDGTDPLVQGLLHAVSYGLAQLRPPRRKLMVSSVAQCLLDRVRDGKRAVEIFASTHVVSVRTERDRIVIELAEAASGRRLRSWEDSASRAGFDARLFALQARVIDEVIAEFGLAAVASRPGLPESVYASYLRALHLARLDVRHSLEAIPLFEKVVEAAPESALAYAGLAEALLNAQYAKNDPSFQGRALNALVKAEQLDPESPQVHAMLGRLHAAGGFWERALAEHQRAAQLDPSTADPHVQMGYANAYLGRMEASEAAFRQAVRIEPRSYRARAAMGLYLYEVRRIDEAEKEWLEAARLAPEQISVLTNLAELYASTGRTAQAIQQARDSIAKRKTLAAFEILGDIDRRAGRYAEAISNYEAAIPLGPPSYKIWGPLATAYRAAGRSEDATKALRTGLGIANRAIAGNPRDGDRLAWAAYYHACLGEPEAARARAQEALNIAANPMMRIRQRLVLTFDALGDRASAIRLMGEAPGQLRQELANLEELSQDLRRDPAIQSWKR